MPITDQDIADLVTTTLNTIKKDNFVDMSQELTEYIVVPYLLTKRGGLIVKKGGVGLEVTLMVEHGGRSRFVGEYDEDVIVVVDHLKKMRLFYSLLTDNLAYTRSELLDNRGQERINNVLKPRRRAMYLRVAETMEENFFQTPDADDDLTPWGLKYWSKYPSLLAISTTRLSPSRWRSDTNSSTNSLAWSSIVVENEEKYR